MTHSDVLGGYTSGQLPKSVGNLLVVHRPSVHNGLSRAGLGT
jgi:hypothetical protein